MKEIWIDEKLYDIPYQIEEELCRQLNNGTLRDPKKVEVIKEFISHAETQ